MAFIFQWNKKKARQNLRNHQVSFEEASTVFGDTLSRTIDDPLHLEDEDRYVIIGQSARGRLLVVVHTMRGEARVVGRDDYAPLVLRATHIFRRENGEWKIIHRHGDAVVEQAQTPPVQQR